METKEPTRRATLPEVMGRMETATAQVQKSPALKVLPAAGAVLELIESQRDVLNMLTALLVIQGRQINDLAEEINGMKGAGIGR